jgi:hypothetical protein
MTQKIISQDKSSSDLLQTIDPKGIADESMRQTVEILLNLIEQLQLKVKDLESYQFHKILLQLVGMVFVSQFLKIKKKNVRSCSD